MGKGKKPQQQTKKIPVIVSAKVTQAPTKPPPTRPKESETDPELPEELPEELAGEDDPRRYSKTALERRAKQREAVLAAHKAGTYP